MAVLIEKPGRRSSLAFYVANVASEALFRIHVARGYIRPVNNGQVYIFTFAMATIMMLAKKHGFEDDPLSAAIKLIVGSEEASLRPRRLRQGSLVAAAAEPALDSSQQVATSTNKEVSKESIGDIRAQPNSGQIVAHSNKVQQLAFLIGYGAQLSFRLLTRAPRLLNQPELLLRSTIGDKSLVRFGLFLSTFSALYKATNCALRWSLDSSTASNCFMAGLVAGPALLIYPSPTIALYVLWKCLEALFHEAVRMKLIKNKNLFIVILYGIATNQLFYSAVLDPRYMKKSYMSFLDRMSQHRLHMVNRSVLDVFGTEASTGYEEFFPDLHPKYMSPAFLGSIWIWMLEQKMLAKRLPASSAAIL
ncbi:hypothetical protein SUGI_1520730 [Cryptomeria japonica]|uniref:Transmembrane protein 135 N-terminal domain-containing protein n=1 Tax=Cryptomeria japonica TaxID=3369 RepID=A0AAD3NPW1_CRYJA|nr:hypothetical protein SUGI_1520730 [Cryptomeria japonica]